MTRSLLATDAYKFSMAAAGFPLRTETFTYTHRRGGPHFLPFDACPRKSLGCCPIRRIARARIPTWRRMATTWAAACGRP